MNSKEIMICVNEYFNPNFFRDKVKADLKNSDYKNTLEIDKFYRIIYTMNLKNFKYFLYEKLCFYKKRRQTTNFLNYERAYLKLLENKDFRAKTKKRI